MKYCFFGGAGEASRPLWQSSFFEGHQGQVFDNLLTGDRAFIGGAARFILGDVRDGLMVDRVIKDFQPQVIVFKPASLDSSFEQFEVQQIGLYNILKAIKKHQIPELIILGDSVKTSDTQKIVDLLRLEYPLTVSYHEITEAKGRNLSQVVKIR